MSDDKATMSNIEEELRMVQDYKEENEVEEHVGGIILDLSCPRNMNYKFYRNMELYWNTKAMVAMGMLPKDHDFRQLKKSMESLEEKNKFLMMMVCWLVKHHGGTFPLPSGGHLHTRSSSTVGPMTSFGLVAP